jgi:hypothetical protein
MAGGGGASGNEVWQKIVGITLALLGAFFTGAAFVFQKKAHNQLPSSTDLEASQSSNSPGNPTDIDPSSGGNNNDPNSQRQGLASPISPTSPESLSGGSSAENPNLLPSTTSPVEASRATNPSNTGHSAHSYLKSPLWWIGMGFSKVFRAYYGKSHKLYRMLLRVYVL